MGVRKRDCRKGNDERVGEGKGGSRESWGGVGRWGLVV